MSEDIIMFDIKPCNIVVSSSNDLLSSSPLGGDSGQYLIGPAYTDPGQRRITRTQVNKMPQKNEPLHGDNPILEQALRQQIADLDSQLDDLERQEEKINEDLHVVQIDKKRNEELREHARALLSHLDSAGSSGLDHLSPSMVSAPVSDQQETSEGFLGRRISGRRRTTSDSLASAVRDILKETEPSPGQPGEPMHYRDLVIALEKSGVYISGHDKGLNLVANIHKNPDFVRPKRGMYGLKEWYPSAQYNVGQRSINKPKRSKDR
jgi:hypothetical protein